MRTITIKQIGRARSAIAIATPQNREYARAIGSLGYFQAFDDAFTTAGQLRTYQESRLRAACPSFLASQLITDRLQTGETN